VVALLEQIVGSLLRRSAWNGESLAGGVFLLDTIGELAALYALADVAFVVEAWFHAGGTTY